ncbi:MAG: hypothetical protein SAK29_30170 [Scytonema sp. PMC 1069.18]|nr:hypothetical protein [Scytonema sp. PMC 1069.18]MEC4887499.1 hypothetical protein [Scytonema sp. PMC 1070.18]
MTNEKVSQTSKERFLGVDSHVSFQVRLTPQGAIARILPSPSSVDIA